MIFNNILLGSDCEWFLQDKNTKEIISAEGIVKGTKDCPFYFDPENDFFATSLDNVLAEGNIPPAKTAYQFYKNLEKLNKYINANIPANLQTLAIPSARLDEKWLATDNAKTFGCQPSINCWTNTKVFVEPTGDNLRSAGLHIHAGYDNPNVEANLLGGKAMDLFLGIPSILIEPDNERRVVGYGAAGNIRHQRHGFEYRSLSSYFASSRKLIQWCFKNTMEAIKFVNEGKSHLIADMGDVIQDIINNNKKQQALEIINQFNIKMA